jgi:signal transduction histidine kinase
MAATTFAPLRARVQRFVDMVLYRDYYDLGPTLERFSHALATVRDQGTVASTLVEDLCDTLNLSGAALVQLPGGFDPAVLRLIEPSDLIASREFAEDDERAVLVAQLAALDPSALHVSHRQPVVRDPFRGCAALVIIGPGGGEDVSALLLVGRKRGGSGLRYEDRTLLGTVAHQAATALENATLIGGLRTTLSQLRRSTEQLEAARAEKQLLLRQLVDAEERQRAALARDIHDDALQDLMYVIRHSRYCATLASSLSKDEQTLSPAIHRLRDELDQVAEAAATSERKLRDLCAGLYPALLESLGLRYAIGALVEDITTMDGLQVQFECEPDAELLADQLDADTRLHAYRITQEALHNVVRHAASSRAAVQLAVAHTPARPGRAEPPTARIALRLSIADDGKGMPLVLPIDYVELLREGHLGLASMRERAERIGASLNVSPNPGGGTLVDLTIPVSARPTSLEAPRSTGAPEASDALTRRTESLAATQEQSASQLAPVPARPAQAGSADERADTRPPAPS